MERRQPLVDQDRITDFYDRFGSRQDSQAFYENRAMMALVDRADFGHAAAVLELGMGTGRFAERLLSGSLSDSCRYFGVDVSSTMVGLATRRLRRWGGRVSILLVKPSATLPAGDLSFDRVVATYVLDLLPEGQIAAFVEEAHRVLLPRGLLCLASLTQGEKLLSRAVCALWTTVHRINPLLVGGCRPIRLTRYVNPGRWDYRFHDTITAFGVPTEVLVARKTSETREERCRDRM